MNASPASQLVIGRLIGLAEPGDGPIERAVPIEAPVALEYSGIGYAVMMATPDHLEDFAIGHAVAEGLVRLPQNVGPVDTAAVDGGWVVRAQLPPASTDAVHARARTRVSDSSCGLCGVESIGEALRPLPPVSGSIRTSRKAIASALAALPEFQPLGRATGATHAAAFCDVGGHIVCIREDVGRHNAFDKLIGAMARASRSMADGFVLLSARCSFELVEKAVRSGVPMLVTVSAPTSLAVDRAKAAGLTLLALARPDSVIVINDPKGSIA
jgi:FdhD protein